MEYLMHGGYILYYAVAVWLLMRYIKGVLTLQEGSVGFAVGGQLLLMVIGLIAGVIISVIYGSIVDIGIYLSAGIYVYLMINNLLVFRQFAEETNKKVIATSVMNKGEYTVKEYVKATVLTIVGVVAAYLISYTITGIYGLGNLLGVLVIFVTLQQYKKNVLTVLEDAPDKTEADYERKAERFDKAESISDIDNKEYIQRLKARVKKIWTIDWKNYKDTEDSDDSERNE